MSNERVNPIASAYDPSDELLPAPDNSFADILSDFEQQQSPDPKHGETIEATVVSVGPELILVDVGRKIEGALPLTKWRESNTTDPQPGTKVTVTVGPRTLDGYYDLSLLKVEHPKDWTGLQAAFDSKTPISGVVLEQVKGGYRVDVGVKAFLPASRSGVRDPDEMPKLVGQEIRCLVTKLDTEKEDVVVDRRTILEQEQAQRKEQRFSELKEGDIVRGRVRSLMDFGAFVELGGVDGLLHVVDMAWTRVSKPGDLVKIGDELELKILKIDPNTKKIGLGLKQLQEDPWTTAARSFSVGQRVSGTVCRLADFGAFVELMPGVDGLVHLSELSWDKKVRKAGDVFKVGDRVEVVILGVDPAAKRISLGYKQILGDPWEAAQQKFAVGTIVEAPVTSVAQFGAFVDLGDGLEGMIHISDITNEKRLDHAKEKVSKGQVVRAAVTELDKERRRVRLSMRQLEPTTLDHFIAEHQAGETVSGRLVEVQGDRAKVELGEGVIATCKLKKPQEQAKQPDSTPAADVSSLSAMLSARWKQGGAWGGEAKEGARAGQVRTFKIANLDASKRLIELELAG